MALEIIKDLPTARNVNLKYPVSEQKHHVQSNRTAVKNVLAGTDPRLLMIVGPCSAWPFEAVEKYSHLLKDLSEKVKDRVLIVMRTYIQKPRTTVGWPGPLNQPDPLGDPDLESGIWQCRKMMDAAAQLHPLADEMLFTHNASHFEPLLSYVALGARSSTDAEHRFIAAGFESGVGVKNDVSGSVKIGVDGVQAVQSPHVFSLYNQEVRASGNPYGHLILRGGGEKRTNYDAKSIKEAAKLLRDAKVKNPAIIVDASHDNTFEKNGHGYAKNPKRQIEVIRDVIAGMRGHLEGYELVRGVMEESFIIEGNQKISSDMRLDGLSITDACTGWEQTESIIHEAADAHDRGW